MSRAVVALALLLVFVFVSSASVATADTDETPLYESHFILHTQAAAGEASSVCSSQHSGFPPNLYIMTQYLSVSNLLEASKVGYNTYVALSGIRTGSTCTTNSNCAWRWSGGPLQSTPVTFYLGRQANVAQDASKANLWDAWDTGCPTVNATSSLNVALYTGTYKWRDTNAGLSGTVFVCEVLGPAPAAASSSKTRIPWWAILIIVVGGVAIVAGVAAGIAVYCCRKKKREKQESGDPQPSETASVGSMGSRASVRTLDTAEVERKWRKYRRQRMVQGGGSMAKAAADGEELTQQQQRKKKLKKKGKGKKKKSKKSKKAKKRSAKKARNADTASQVSDTSAFSRRSESTYTENAVETMRSGSTRSLARYDSAVFIDIDSTK